MQFRYARNLKVKDLEVNSEKPDWVNWQSALCFEDVDQLCLQGFSGGPARFNTDIPAVVLDKVDDVTIVGAEPRHGTKLLPQVKGANSRRIYLVGNALHDAETPYSMSSALKPATVKVASNF
jgi:hypothetical protein